MSAEQISTPPENIHPQFEGVSLGGEGLRTHLVQGNVPVGRDLVKWTLEVPEEPRYDGIGLIIPGFLGIKQSSRNLRNALAQEGISSVSYSPPRDGEEPVSDTFLDPQGLHAKALGSITDNLQERQGVIKRFVPGGNKLDFDKYLLLPHSMGGLAAPRHALTMPSGIHAIYGLATTGFGNPTLGQLLVDIPRKGKDSVIHEIIPAAKSGAIELNWRNFSDVTRYVNRLRFIFEGISCITTDGRHNVSEDVGRLEDRGVPYIYNAFGRDMLVRPDEEKVGAVVTRFILMEKYGHLAPQAKAEKVAKQIADVVLSTD